MKKELIEAAMTKVPNAMVLINVVSRRVRQINQGHRPLVADTNKLSPMDIALKEIAEGKVSYEAADPEGADDEKKKKKK